MGGDSSKQYNTSDISHNDMGKIMEHLSKINIKCIGNHSYGNYLIDTPICNDLITKYIHSFEKKPKTIQNEEDMDVFDYVMKYDYDCILNEFIGTMGIYSNDECTKLVKEWEQIQINKNIK